MDEKELKNILEEILDIQRITLQSIVDFHSWNYSGDTIDKIKASFNRCMELKNSLSE